MASTVSDSISFLTVTDVCFLKINPPSGWTTNDNHLDYENSWSRVNSPGYLMASELSLDDPQPIMRTTPETGEPCYLFRSGNNFFLWNEIEDTVWEIIRPQDLNAIIKAMDEKGMKGLKIKERKP